MRTREQILDAWNATQGALRDKINEFWLELFLDIRDLAGGVQPGPGLLAELEAIHAAVDANLPDIKAKVHDIDIAVDLAVEETEKLVLGQEQTAQMVKDCLTKIIELLEKLIEK